MTGSSPLETVGVAIAVAAMIGVGLLWGIGMLVASILGSTLPGGGQGVAAIVQSFPDIGAAWVPAIPSGLIWATALVVWAVFAPLVWRVVRPGSLRDEGSQWATTADLRRAGLLMVDAPLPHAAPEEPQ
jgi:hypothetical protein